LLLYPYLAWVFFASILNFAVYYLNRLPQNIPFTSCLEASSPKEYLTKKGITDINFKQVTPPYRTTPIDISLYQNISRLGGGDTDSYSFVKYRNFYCPLNPANIKQLFNPIVSENYALNLYLFLNHDLGSAVAQSQHIFLLDLNYDESDFVSHSSRCKGKVPRTLSTAKKVGNDYLLSIIGFNWIGDSKYFQRNIVINSDTTIKKISETTLLSCGPGAVF
jgi:hypothetical protein